MTTRVFLAIDDEGMLGGSSSEDIDKIDVPASYDNYLAEFSKKIKAIWPDVEIETFIGSTTYSTRVTSDELDCNETDDMTLTIQDMGAEVYESGLFWVEK